MLDGRCFCADGYTGSSCEMATCEGYLGCNNGICEIVEESHLCLCYGYYTGTNCDRYSCSIKENCFHGTCVELDDGNSYCRCNNGYYGEQCDRYECSDKNPCVHGKCVGTNEKSICVCEANFKGPSCEIPVCDSFPCPPGRMCIIKENQHTCGCLKGYFGDDCNILGCNGDNHPCQNGATCGVIEKSSGCLCLEGYTGRLCEYATCENNKPCVHGLCSLKEYQATCQCREGYTGKYCESLECDKEKYCGGRENSETCVKEGNKIECLCIKGKVGLSCKTETCLNITCQNGGKCFIQNGLALCHCPSSYKGIRCEIDICSPMNNPCKQGICVNKGYSYSCNCDSGWSGNHCDIESCSNEKSCKNGGRCIKVKENYECECNDGYSGRFCEYSSCKSDDHICLNNSTCQMIDGVTKCICDPSKSTGDRCEYECPERCLHGVCKNTNNNKAGCECHDDYSPPNCEFKKCDNSYCNHKGYCQIINNERVCWCFSDSTSKVCLDCDQECFNNGECIFNKEGNPVCRCHQDYSGIQCEKEKRIVTSRTSDIYKVGISLALTGLVYPVFILGMFLFQKHQSIKQDRKLFYSS